MVTWRIPVAFLFGSVFLIPLVNDEHIQHRAIWFLLELLGLLWAMSLSQDDGRVRGVKKYKEDYKKVINPGGGIKF